MKQSKWNINLFDVDQQQSFQNLFYISKEDENNYINILEKMVEELIKMNLEIDPNKFRVILIGGVNPKERTVVLEKGK